MNLELFKQQCVEYKIPNTEILNLDKLKDEFKNTPARVNQISHSKIKRFC